MSQAQGSSRRDPRFNLRPGMGQVTFHHPDSEVGQVSGALSRLSVAGLGFEVEAGLAGAFPPGILLAGASVRIGDCRLQGEISVRNSSPLGDDKIEIGCLFYPASAECERQLVSILAGMEAVLEPSFGHA